MLIDRLPTCFACELPATRWRLPRADKWGMDPLQNYKMLEEAEAYEIWEERGVPDDAYGTCDGHFLFKPGEEGNIVLTVAGQRALAQEGTRKKRTQTDRKHELRLELISKLGGKCEVAECEEARPPYLQIYWTPGVRPAKYSGLEWLRFLARDGSWTNCVLRCVRHPYVPTRQARSSPKDEVLDAYGAQCDTCGETDREVLQIQPGPRTTAPRYPGGRKMGSRDKYRWLKSHGFPAGWFVRCSSCAVGGRGLSS